MKRSVSLESDAFRFTLKHQWWDPEFLITELKGYGNPNPVTHVPDSIWRIIRENRKTGEVTLLDPPESATAITAKNGVLWAMTLPPQGGNIRILRCDDFKHWNPIGSMKGGSFPYVGLFEVLDGNRFLLYARLGEALPENGFAVAEVDAKGRLGIHHRVPMDGLKEALWKYPSYYDSVRTPDYIVSVAKGPGWGLVFDAHTGAFQRRVRCYEYPTDQAFTCRHMDMKVLQILLPTADGQFLMACRTEDFAKEYADTGASAGLIIDPRWGRNHAKHPGLVWRLMEPGTGAMKPIEAPANAKTKLDAGPGSLDYALCQAPDGSLRPIEAAAALR